MLLACIGMWPAREFREEDVLQERANVIIVKQH